MHLKSWPSKFVKLFAGDSASLTLVTIKVESLLTLFPPRRTGVVGAVKCQWMPPGGRPMNNTMSQSVRLDCLGFLSQKSTMVPTGNLAIDYGDGAH